MTNDEMAKKYDLEERTSVFAEKIIKLCKKVPRSPINDPLVNQLTKCGTSQAANYCEADDAESKDDFKHKIGICKKETRECKFFLRMMIVNLPELKEEAEVLKQEAKELNLIFNTIYRKVKKNN